MDVIGWVFFFNLVKSFCLLYFIFVDVSRTPTNIQGEALFNSSKRLLAVKFYSKAARLCGSPGYASIFCVNVVKEEIVWN